MSEHIADKYAAWEREAEERFQTLKRNEEELNRIFIDIYGLSDELTPEVADKGVGRAVRLTNASVDGTIKKVGNFYCRR
jgi:hypothetical protein